jgi:hypothetical protein
MLRVPASPRARRRLRRVALLGAALVTGVLIAFLAPNHKPANPAARGNEGPAQLASDAPQVSLSAADRRAIDAILDRFVPAAMERRSPEAAWALAGPELKSGSTLAAWKAGTTPVPYYPARQTTFHYWQAIDVTRGSVIFNILLHPKPGNTLAPTVFSGQMVKRGGRWLVNRMYTIAIMNPTTRTTHEIGPADFAAPPAVSQTPSGKPVLGKIAIVPALAILALILLIPLSLGVVALVRARRWRRMVRASERNELPPLPSTYPQRQDEHNEIVSQS